MVITWRLTGDGIGALTMCDFDRSCTPGVLLETEYSAMELTDLTGDGATRSAPAATDHGGQRVARLYQSCYAHGGRWRATSTTRPSRSSGCHSGHVRAQLPAVFAEERTTAASV